jgi:uncharacterized protein YfaS (alpha-2-macroglobulin family)
VVGDAAESSADAAEPAAVQVRHDFRSTALWVPDLVTDERGEARIEVPFPDSLTGWRATARAADRRTRVGIARTEVRTRKPLLVRLETPRFLVVGDVATISASIHNDTDQKLTVIPSLVTSGLASEGGSDSISIPAHGEGRVEWTASAREAGEASLEVSVRGGELSDAMRRSLPIYAHGIEKLETAAGKLRGAELRASVTLPKRRRSTRLEILLAPSLAVAMLDALPYLIEYPYGCTEQTMSRFLPAVITARTLAKLGLAREDVVGRVFGGIERDHAAETHPRGSRDLDELGAVVHSGLARLADFQHGDGGFGWWKPGASDPFMSAYVVWGLVLARDADLAVDQGMLEKALRYLDRTLVEKMNELDTQAWMLHALAAHHASSSAQRPSEFESAAFENLLERREQLNVYSRALLTLTAHAFGERKSAEMLVRNLENGVKTEGTPVTRAHWGEAGIRGRWSEGGVEATAFALRALLAVAPEHPLVEPAAAWLVENRRGAQWKSTRDTAIVVLALNDYLRQSGELEADLDVAVFVNDRLLAERSFTPADVLRAPSRIEVDPSWLRDGENQIRISRTRGESPLYFAAEARFFSLEEPITPAGDRIAVARAYQKLAPQPTLLAGPVYDRVPVGDGDRVPSGARIETTLSIEAKNQFEYLIFEDLKPAGFEAVAVQSGEMLRARRVGGSEERPVYAELRDRKLALFIDQLPEGSWEIQYELRAQTPGAFHALPLIGQAMYVPEIRANGAEVRLRIE